MSKLPIISLILYLQGAVYFGTGIWPLVSERTFEKVTGPKKDFWLVKTVGLIVGVLGVVMLMAGYRQKAPPEVSLMAVGTAASLTAVDIVYVAKKRISPVYLLDALFEMGLLALWTFALRQTNR
jgi:hypothetical protein